MLDFFKGKFLTGSITIQVRTNAANDGPHGPCPGGPQFPALATQTRCLVLITESRIAGEIIAVVMLDNPCHRGIREGPSPQDRIVRGHIGIERTRDGQQCSSGVTLMPEGVAVAEGVLVKCRIPLFTMPT